MPIWGWLLIGIIGIIAFVMLLPESDSSQPEESEVQNAAIAEASPAQVVQNTPTSRPTAQATQPIEAADPVLVSIKEDRASVAANTPVELYIDWITKSPTYHQEFLGAVSMGVLLDGQNQASPLSYWGTPTQKEDYDGDGIGDYYSRWIFALDNLSIGAHEFEITLTISHDIQDGFDFDGDGVLDRSSGSFNFTVTLLVE